MVSATPPPLPTVGADTNSWGTKNNDVLQWVEDTLAQITSSLADVTATLSGVNTTAGSALTKATTALQQAQQALTTANSAANAIATANTNASSALTTAQAAQTTASSAVSQITSHLVTASTNNPHPQYVRSVNGATPDASGNVTIAVSSTSTGGTSTGGTTVGGSGGAVSSGGSFLFGVAAQDVANGKVEGFLGFPVMAAATWNDSGDAIANQWTIDGEYGSWTKLLDAAIGGPNIQGGQSWSTLASGGYDSTWQGALNTLKTKWGSRDTSKLYIRFAHEVNGQFMPWTINNGDQTNYIAAFRRISSMIRATIPGAKVVWGMNEGSGNLADVRTFYPGDAYVDCIGVDTYNQYSHITDSSGWNSKINAATGSGGPIGIEKWRQFALQQGKYLVVPEWGNPLSGSGGGNGDDPYWTAAMCDYFVANAGSGAGQIYYACYFNDNQPAEFRFWTQATGTLQPNVANAIKTHGKSV